MLNQEYASMVADWVDPNAEIDENIMNLAGNNFRKMALRRSGSFGCENDDVHDTISTRGHIQASDGVEPPIPESRSKCQRCASLSPEDRKWPAFSHRTKRMRASFDSSTFCAFEYDRDELAVILAELFYSLDLDKRLGISRSAVQTFILTVRARMPDNPYHNWTHVVDVTQTVFWLARECGILERLSARQQLGLFIGAMCHDLEHPGVTAGYLLKSHSAIAARYKDDPAVLEKHHAFRALEMLSCCEIRLLHALPAADRVAITATVRDVILATDMTRHALFLAAVRRRAEPPPHGAAPAGGAGDAPPPAHAPAAPAPLRSVCATPPPPRAASAAAEGAATGASGAARGGLNTESDEGGAGGGAGEEELTLEIQVLLKCADISNVVKPFAAAQEWAVCVTDEFFAQGDLEREGGIEPATPMCDRAAQTRVGLQKGFIDVVARPFYCAVGALLPGVVAAALPQMEANRAAWEGYTDERLLKEVAAARARRREERGLGGGGCAALVVGVGLEAAPAGIKAAAAGAWVGESEAN